MRAVRCHWKHVTPTLTLLVHRLQNLRESGKFQDSAQQNLHISTATHTTQNASHLVVIVCFVIYAFYVTEVVDQFIQHINYCLLLYHCVFCTHSFNHLKELNSCDSNKGTQYTSAWEEAFLYKLKSPNVHCLRTCPFPCNVDISYPLQHRQVFCLLSSSSANQKPGVNFHSVTNGWPRNNSTSYLKFKQNKLRCQESTVIVGTGLLAGISRAEFQVGTRGLFWKWPGCHSHHSSPTSTKVNTEWSYTCAPPHMSPWHRLSKNWKAGKEVRIPIHQNITPVCHSVNSYAPLQVTKVSSLAVPSSCNINSHMEPSV